MKNSLERIINFLKTCLLVIIINVYALLMKVQYLLEVCFFNILSYLNSIFSVATLTQKLNYPENFENCLNLNNYGILENILMEFSFIIFYRKMYKNIIEVLLIK